MRVYFLQFDVQGRSGPNPFQDKRVREAVAHAINREAIVKNLIGAGSRVWHAFCFETQSGAPTDVRRSNMTRPGPSSSLPKPGIRTASRSRFSGFRTRQRIEAIMGNLAQVGIKGPALVPAIRGHPREAGQGAGGAGRYELGLVLGERRSAMINPFFTHMPDDMVHDPEIKAWAEAASEVG
jgi:peptide/nickel transport system substrate-binding protein